MWKSVIEFTLSPDQKGIETRHHAQSVAPKSFTLSPDQKGIETLPGAGSTQLSSSH